MRVSVIQSDPTFGSRANNVQQALSIMRTCSADLYVLPELFASGYNFVNRAEAQQLSEPFSNGDTFKAMSKFVRDRQCHVVYGFAESHEDKLFNSAAILGYDGTRGLYRKVHLFDREKLFFEPGDLGFQVFDTSIGKIGLMICFDWYFPESARTLTLKGAQLIAHPANLVLPNCPACMPTRCLENRIFVATANRVGTEARGGHDLRFIGKSQIVTPQGSIFFRASDDKPEAGVAEIDISDADNKSINDVNDLLRDRRVEAYSCL
jgi:5-aminopentanamidase